MTETEVARIERDEQAGLAALGLQLAETKQLTAALQARIVPAQVAVLGERRRGCTACGRVLASKGHYGARFRSLFGDVAVRIRRLHVCPCQGSGEAKSFAVLDLGNDAVAPELAYVTARHAALVPFGKVAILLSDLLPMDGAQNTGTIRNRTLRVGQDVVRQHATGSVKHPPAQTAGPVVVGLDGGYVRSRHRQEERHFEVVAGKVIHAEGAQHRFAFARNGQAIASEAFRQALTAAGVQADTPATVLCDGDWTERKLLRDVAGGGRLQQRVNELLGYLERNEDALAHYAARRRRGEAISTAFVESTVNEIVAKRMNKKQQMRWNRATVQPFLDVRTAVLNNTLEDAFRYRHPGFRPANDDHGTTTAAA